MCSKSAAAQVVSSWQYCLKAHVHMSARLPPQNSVIQSHQALSAELCLQVADPTAATELDLITPTAATPNLATVMPAEAPIADKVDNNMALNTEEAESGSQMSPNKVRHSCMHDASQCVQLRYMHSTALRHLLCGPAAMCHAVDSPWKALCAAAGQML